MGARPQSELRRLLPACDVFCLPSLVETWGVVVNEALAAGLPVITTRRVGAAPDLVASSGAGLVVKEGRPDALLAALSLLAEDADLRAKMGGAAWNAVRGCSYQAGVESFVGACRAALAPSSPEARSEPVDSGSP